MNNLFDILQEYLSNANFTTNLLVNATLESQPLAVIFSILIFLVFAWFYGKMRGEISVATAKVCKLKNLIEEAAGLKKIGSFSELRMAQKNFLNSKKQKSFESKVETNNLVSEWQQIDFNLTYEVGGNGIYSSIDFINSFLNFDKFMKHAISRSVLMSPSILTSLGIIGTFLGLSLGVGSAASGLASPNIEDARAAMSDLLSGAQVAFTSSLVGLFFALIMRLQYARYSERIRKHINQFNQFLGTIAVPRDSGNSGLAHLINISRNTGKLENSDVSYQALNASMMSLVSELKKYSEPTDVR